MSTIDFIVVLIYFVAVIAMALTLVFKACDYDYDDEEELISDNISIDFDDSTK